MEIKLIGALDYNKVKDIIGKYVEDDTLINSIVSEIKDVEIARHSEVVSAAGRLSRFPGNVNEVLKKSESFSLEKNSNFANRVISMGHKSITDHDYLLFSLEDVSVILEHILICERFASFTIKSRREVDFRSAGYYVPDFHDVNGNIIDNNNELKQMYKNHMDKLFNRYGEYVDKGISKEDARFILPYSFYSNIIMGIDAHTLLDMIIKFTKTKYAKIKEVNELGNKLYEIASIYTPYLIPYIDLVPVNYNDSVDEYLAGKIERENYKILDRVKLLNSSNNIDDTILASAIARRYEYDYDKSLELYKKVFDNDDIKLEFMKHIAFDSDKLELSQVNFTFQIPVSYAVLTHFERHRTYKFLLDDFTHVDSMQYKKPPRIKAEDYSSSFIDSNNIKDLFKKYGVRDEDLIYFTLAGNMTNIVANMDGWTVRHILELRECTKAQWETRAIAHDIHKEIDNLKHAKIYSKILGSTCMTQGICNEGKESCGKIKLFLK